MAGNAVPNFLPSKHGFHFANRWPTGPALSYRLGLLHVGVGDPALGLCGGMAYAARDRFDRGETAPAETSAPANGTPLFREIVNRQVDSFDRFIVVPLRFWMATRMSPERRLKESVTNAWPAIRAQIDAGEPAMVGIIRSAPGNPFALDIGHQVAAYRYESSPEQVRIGIYDPNHPDDDTVELVIDKQADGSVALSQSTGEPVLGLLDLPYVPPRAQAPTPG